MKSVSSLFQCAQDLEPRAHSPYLALATRRFLVPASVFPDHAHRCAFCNVHDFSAECDYEQKVSNEGFMR